MTGVTNDDRYTLRCEICGTPLQTLDLPCPLCDPIEITEHVTTIQNRHRGLFRNRPTRFVDDINEWLARQSGLLGLTFALSWDVATVVREITITYVVGHVDTEFDFRFDRVALTKDPLALFGRTTVGSALERWAAEHSDRQPVTHVAGESAGIPFELWILSTTRQSNGGD